MTRSGSSAAANAEENSPLPRPKALREDQRGNRNELSSIQTQGFFIATQANLD
jgi:hypothetical protein